MLYDCGTIGLGILAWRGSKSLEIALKSYAENNFFSLFDDAMIFLPDPDEQVQNVARQYPLRIETHKQNLGILGGMEEIAKRIATDYIFFTENDNPLLENKREAKRQIIKALQLLASKQAIKARMRHTKKPGEKFDILGKYKRYYPNPDTPAAKIRRILRPGKALRLSGTAIYAEQNPDKKFPKTIKNAGDGFYLVDCKTMAWTNQSIIIDREFFLDTIIPYCKSVPFGRNINGFRSIEIELNRSKFWINSGWKIACGCGLLGHERAGDRGY